MPTDLPTASQCDDFGAKLKGEISDFYTPRLALTDAKIKEVQDAGGDPTKYSPPNAPAITIDLLKLKNEVVKARDAGLGTADQKVGECKVNGVPDLIGDHAQKFEDLVTMLTAWPIILLTKDYAAFNIDLGEIFKGNVLGSDSAFIPQIRGEVLDRLGIGGVVRTTIENPQTVFVQAPVQVVQAVGNTIFKAIGIPWSL